jgi:peptide/nickel transport system permease protein
MTDPAGTVAAEGTVPAAARVGAREPERSADEHVSQGFYRRAWRKLRRDPTSIAAAVVLSLIVLITIVGPPIAESVLHTTFQQQLRLPDGRLATLQPPSPTYPLGTDDLARDVLTRLLYAGRVSLTIGFAVAIVSIVVGTAAGMVAGYFGGWVDDTVNAGVQFVFNIPGLFILILLSVLFRPNDPALAVLFLSLIFGFFFWPATARQVRGVVLSTRTLDYVSAVRGLGGSDWRIMLRHILPNVANIVMVVAGLDVAAAILGESALSFLGFGVPVPLASWGNMLSGSQDMFRKAPWLVYPPGLMIFLTVLGVVLLTDGLRDALDPRV